MEYKSEPGMGYKSEPGMGYVVVKDQLNPINGTKGVAKYNTVFTPIEAGASIS